MGAQTIVTTASFIFPGLSPCATAWSAPGAGFWRKRDRGFVRRSRATRHARHSRGLESHLPQENRSGPAQDSGSCVCVKERWEPSHNDTHTFRCITSIRRWRRVLHSSSSESILPELICPVGKLGMLCAQEKGNTVGSRPGCWGAPRLLIKLNGASDGRPS